MFTEQEMKVLLAFMDRMEYKGLNEAHFANAISQKLVLKLQELEGLSEGS